MEVNKEANKEVIWNHPWINHQIIITIIRINSNNNKTQTKSQIYLCHHNRINSNNNITINKWMVITVTITIDRTTSNNCNNREVDLHRWEEAINNRDMGV
jgi:hypothetical protein